MVEIHYCDERTIPSWNYSVSPTEHCEISESQEAIDEWFADFEARWPLDTAKEIPAPNEHSIEQLFIEQAEKWARETGHVSSPGKRTMHPSYQAILGMGKPVIPFMLRDLRDNRRPWFWALSYLTNDNPINPKDAGRMDQMIAAWISWGAAKGIL